MHNPKKKLFLIKKSKPIHSNAPIPDRINCPFHDIRRLVKGSPGGDPSVLSGGARERNWPAQQDEAGTTKTYRHSEDGLLALVNLTLVVGHDDGFL